MFARRQVFSQTRSKADPWEYFAEGAGAKTAGSSAREDAAQIFVGLAAPHASGIDERLRQASWLPGVAAVDTKASTTERGREEITGQ